MLAVNKNQNLFRENYPIYLLNPSADKSLKGLSQPGGMEEALFGNPEILRTQIEAAKETPDNLITDQVNDTRGFLKKTAEIPFELLKNAGEYVVNTAERAGHAANRAVQLGTTIATAAASVPGVIVSKTSTTAVKGIRKIFSLVFSPFRWLLNHIPFTQKIPKS